MTGYCCKEFTNAYDEDIIQKGYFGKWEIHGHYCGTTDCQTSEIKYCPYCGKILKKVNKE
ncbi:hypothetical protein LCGC14_0224180 [marine sediment metagenome]|uniref:Uncharacterized protein n=1 Tax=marine sediment metagenome TaxID=412755 RepID=A0A0F9UCD6_9ZZZZ